MRRAAAPVMYAGFLAIVFGLSEYHGRYIGRYEFVETSRFGWATSYVALMCVAGYGLGLPDAPRSTRNWFATALATAVLGSVAISFVQLFVGDTLLPRFVVFGSALSSVLWSYPTWRLAGAGRAALEERDRVIVVGNETLGAELALEVRRNPEKPASIVGCISERDAVGIESERQPLLDLVTGRRASVLVLSASAQVNDRIIDQAALLHEAGVRVRSVSLFYEEWLGKIPLTDLGRVSLFFDIGEVHRERFARFKRVLDILSSVAGMVAFAASIPVVLIGNAIANRGPLFYVQERIGRAGAVFRIVKFRTMRADHSALAEWTVHDDPRITPFGRVLRKTHVDELPQVWNILRGDLSVVGPRPEQPRYVRELVDKLPFYDLRHIVRPGLTGWAQVKYGYAGDDHDALEKLQYDFHYLRRQSLTFDLRIIGRTLRAVLGGEGWGR